MPAADEGQLILVDLAGSERYDDSKDHDRARMEESREVRLFMTIPESHSAMADNIYFLIRTMLRCQISKTAFALVPRLLTMMKHLCISLIGRTGSR